jgi:DNA-binding MarR family transcriptional regulator
MRIEEELNISQFANEYIKAGINVLYTAAWLTNILSVELRTFKLSFPQYNVLRILLFATENQANINYLSQRMVAPNSNITRIVDKLVAKKLAARVQNTTDKRKIHVVLTNEGKKLAYELNKFLEITIPQKITTLNYDDVVLINTLLDKARG